MTGARLPAGSVWADPSTAGRAEQPGSTARAVALEKALAAAREAGASQATAEALAADAAAARREAADTRPLGARLDSARARMKKAEARVTASAAALAQAQERCVEARAQLETEVATAPTAESPPVALVQGHQAALLRCTKELLQMLETGNFAATADLPPELVGAMTAVHHVVRTMEPELAPTLDGPLEPEATAAPAAGESNRSAGDASASGERDGDGGAESEDEIMADLDGAHDEDEASLLLIARRLKRARQA